MYFLLIFLLIGLLVLNIILFRNDVFCPPVALNLTFLFCALFGLLMYREWDLPSYGWQAVVCIIGGLSVFSAVSYFSQIVVLPRGKVNVRKQLYTKRMEVNSTLLLLLVFFSVYVTILRLRYTQNIVAQYYDVSTFSQMVFNYRALSNNTALNISMPIYLLITGNISLVCSAISMFMLAHNVLFGLWKKRDFPHILMCLTWLLQSFLGGGRTYLLIILSMSLYAAVFFLNIRYGFQKKITVRLMKYAFVAFIGFLAIFLLLVVGLGRKNSLSDINIITYLEAYISGGVRNLDLFMKVPPPHTALSGHETFFALSKKFVPNFNAVRHLEFRFIHGLSSGNVYTAFRRFYSDFGFIGVVILSAIQAVIFSSLYFIVKRNAMKGRISFLTFLFCYFSYTTFYIAIDDLFYSSVLTVSTILRVITFYVIFHIIIQKDIIITCGNRKLI